LVVFGKRRPELDNLAFSFGRNTSVRYAAVAFCGNCDVRFSEMVRPGARLSGRRADGPTLEAFGPLAD
jgi:hypothetical protein